MNRINKVTSVFTIMLFMAMWVTPLLSATNCDMECCAVPMEMNCEMDMASDSCCPTVTGCSNVIYIPIVIAPLLTVNIKKDLTIDYLTSVEIIPSVNETTSVPLYQLKILIYEVHPGFQTPLLV